MASMTCIYVLFESVHVSFFLGLFRSRNYVLCFMNGLKTNCLELTVRGIEGDKACRKTETTPSSNP